MSSLQKLIILNVIDQRWDKMKVHIIPSQAAYRRRIPTIAQVFAIEFVIEKSEGGLQFSHKNKLKSEIFNGKKSL